MGGCMSNRSLSRPTQRPNVRLAGPDLSSMDLDHLLRTGIAEAQLATVARVDRDRNLHLHRARAVFTEALKKNGSRDESLREHLLDVIRRLGENARDRVRASRDAVERTPSRGSDVQSSLSLGSQHTLGRTALDDQEISRNVSRVDHSSEESPMHETDYVVMNDANLMEGSDTEEISSRTSANPRQASQSAETDEIVSNIVSIAGEAWDSSSLLNKSTPLSSPASSKSSKEKEPLSDYFYPIVSEGLHEEIQSRTRSVASSESHSSDELAVSQIPSPHRARLSQTRKSWAYVDGHGVVGESKDTYSRVRALQPLQSASSQGVKRRQLKSKETMRGESGTIDAKLELERKITQLLPRHSRRQPSQSSSSGSQGAVSDSESSAITKRACIPLANAIEEEPADFMKRQRASYSFEPPDRSILHEEDHSHGDAVGSRPSPGTSSYAGSGEEQSLAHEIKTSSDSLTPVLEKAAPFESHSGAVLEKATPSIECNVQNPLSRLELFLGDERILSRASSGNASLSRASSGNVSPRTESAKTSMSRSSSISWPPIELSPFCEAATAGTQITSPLGSTMAPSSSVAEKMSVRVLNGVSGEEEVRFPVPLQGSFSEQQFYAMLDRLCQKHAGQALSDLSWLSQAEPGGRFQRRKCSLAMMEEFFCQDDLGRRTGPLVLLLCTVPATPPSEMPANTVRLRSIHPDLVCHGTPLPVLLRLDTSLLEEGHRYSVAFTHQWTHVTYASDASLFPTRRGLEISVPWQMLKEAGSNTEGLYDVHVVTDCSYRSENRRTLTVGSADSEFSCSSTAMSTAQSSFVPLR